MSDPGGGASDEYKREESVALLVIVSLAALSLLSLIAAFAYYCYITRKVSRRKQSLYLPKRSASPPPPPPLALPPPPPQQQQQQGKESPSSNSASDGAGAVVVAAERGVQVFSYRQLHASTGGFGRANMVGQGSFGAVYRGVLPDGRKVAVKLMDRPGKQGEEEFEMEVKTSATKICVFFDRVLAPQRRMWVFTCAGIGAGTNFTTSSSDLPQFVNTGSGRCALVKFLRSKRAHCGFLGRNGVTVRWWFLGLVACFKDRILFLKMGQPVVWW
jgi:hypothetical protein